MSLPAPLPLSCGDAALLHRYQTAPDGKTFRPLVEKHLPLVWSTARRLANGDDALAEDVTQIVFADFARKAPALPPDFPAAGWLHRHTCFTARKLVRTEVRRRTREHHAAQLLTDHAMTADPDPSWPEAAPHLDAALDQLSASDRTALLLRYWQGQDHRSIGTALGTTEDAARKRIARALEKLRHVLRRRGVLLTAALLTQFLTEHTLAAVPPALAATLPGTAWRLATAAGPVAPRSVSLLRRFLPATAAILAVGGLLWTAAYAGWFGKDQSGNSLTTSPSGLKSASNPAHSAVPLSLHFALANVPAQSIAHRLLTLTPGADDAALLAQIRSLSGQGGSLTEYDHDALPGQTSEIRKLTDYPYGEEWVWDPATQRAVTTAEHEFKSLGTTLEIKTGNLSGDLVELSWHLRHHYAEPEFHAWSISLEEDGGDPANSVRMADFHEAEGSGRISDLAENQPRLLMAQHLSETDLPDQQPGPRALLLFVTLTPP